MLSSYIIILRSHAQIKSGFGERILRIASLLEGGYDHEEN